MQLIEKKSTRKTLIQSVERALDILEIVGKNNQPMRSGAIAQAMDVSLATASNLIRTLYLRGYLAQTSGGYVLGVKNFVLGTKADIWQEMRIVSREPLQQLCQASGNTCFLGVLYQQQVLAINVMTSNNPLGITMRQNWLDKYHSTAAGKVLLSGLSESALEDLLAKTPLEQCTEYTICDPEKLKADIAQVTAQGFAAVKDENVFGCSSAGIPIYDPGKKIIAALSISFSSYFMNESYLKKQLELLQKCRADLENALFPAVG